jgi:hypothetical protein
MWTCRHGTLARRSQRSHGHIPARPGNSRAFHEYPFLVYEFADGVYVIGQLGGNQLVGARVTAIGGISIAQVLARVEPLVPHDNETTGVRNVRSMYLLSEEVLKGLGIAPRFDLTLRSGKHVERTPAPVSARAYSHAFDGIGPPMWPNVAAHAADRHADARVSLLAHRRVVYLAYNTTTVDTSTVSTRVLGSRRSGGCGASSSTYVTTAAATITRTPH